jgi:flagellar biosynthesis/type III secretory pathway protein FliH
VRSEILEAREQASAIIDAAKQRARELGEAALVNADQLREQAERAGYDAGLAKAIADCISLTRSRAVHDERQLEANIALAQILAERLVGRALALEPGLVAEIAQTALKEVRGLRSVRIAAHPTDAHALRKSLDAGALGPQVLEVTENQSLAPGDLIIETESGRLDAELGDRIERLARSIRDRLEREG